MTTQETQSEIDEILAHKYGLTEKINHNTKELFRIENEIKRLNKFTSNKERRIEIRELERLKKRGTKLLREHKKDRAKLSNINIARELNLSASAVSKKQSEFFEGKQAVGVNFSQYQTAL